MFLVLTLFLLLASARATLHCDTEAESVSALRATCFADLGCRAFFGKMSAGEFAHLVTQRLHLVRDWDSALAGAQSAFHGDDDVRHHFWPQAWRNATPTLLAFGALPVDLGSAAASLLAPDCATLAASTASALPPSELIFAVHQLVEYAVFLSDERQCNPDSEVLVLDPDTGESHCMLAANHVCASSTDMDNTLTMAALSLGTGLVAFAVIVLLALTPYAFYKLRRLPSSVEEDTRFMSMRNMNTNSV